MPFLQAMLGTLNDRFCERKIDALVDNAELFAPGDDWLDRMAGLPGESPNPLGIEYLRSFPAGLLEMLRAVVYENLRRGPDGVLSITWAWAPAYDFEIQAWECPGTAGSNGAFTILIKSRYPLDSHPGGESAA